ncbi:MAG TPA: hypothetical protein VKZ92_03065 [Pseudohongiella sp.]|nr:hypothetical protein [Pseudohongiella sp.]
MDFRKLAAAVLMAGASVAYAQHDQNAGHGQAQGMDHSMHMMHMQGGHQMMHSSQGASSQPTEAGQDVFAAIQEIVALLEADPATDWSTVNIDALRDHLVDMNRVMEQTKVQRELIEGGVRYQITGEGEVVGSIKRMVPAHAQQLRADSGWQSATSELSDGVTLSVSSADAGETVKIRALGFYGLMVLGDHHQPHHLMMATGQMDHAHHH